MLSVTTDKNQNNDKFQQIIIISKNKIAIVTNK